MRKSILVAGFLLVAGISAFAQTHSWEGIHEISLSEAEENFNLPPSEFASHVIWGWEGPMDIGTIRADLDSIKTKGFRSVIFEAGYRLPYEYLSDDWFKAIRTAVKEAKKRGLKVWIIDEGKYPSGFAGGKFSKERPDLRMKAVVAVDTIMVGKGESLKDFAVTPKALSAVAIGREGQQNRIVPVRDGKISFDAGDGSWDILLAGTDYRTGQTRAVNNPTGGKDTTNSICDYLSPEAVGQFIEWTHEQYKKYIGPEFGKTVLGFRGDEPDFAYTPWTPGMVREFRQRKGYDPTPYLATLLAPVRTVADKRFKADYWDVWSELFAVSFFKRQADWCAENGLAHITHLNNDHNMPVCVKAGGDLFRNLSKIQIPGVDAIWNQIWPETENDFPKFASSVSHAYGKPRCFSESFAAYYTSPSIPQAKYVVDYQVVRGVNFFEFMFWMAGSQKANWMTDPGMKSLNDYTNRATYLMAQGKPNARIAVYYPTSTLWMDDNAVNPDLVSISRLLLQHQRDFDWLDDDAFTEALRVEDGTFVNLSGQKYSTLIIPSCDVISREAWDRIYEFAADGGKLLFWGRRPTMLAGRSFLRPESFPDTPEALQETSVAWTRTVEAAMPEAELSIILPPKPETRGRRAPQDWPKAEPTAHISYTARKLTDGKVYFIFNEGEQECSFKATLEGDGAVSEWDATAGEVRALSAGTSGSSARVLISGSGRTTFEFSLKPWESVIISIAE